MSLPDSFLENTPLFNIVPSRLGPSQLKDIFEHWPKETLDVLQQAQDLRDQLMNHLDGRFGNGVRIQDVDNYLSTFVNISKEKLGNVRIGSSRKHKFQWRQCVFVTEKYQERSFPATYCENEELHLIMLRAILLMNQGYDEQNANHPEAAVTSLRQAAGIFQYLSSDRIRNMDATTVPIEFQEPIFTAFMNLALGQVYAIIAAKGESNGMNKSALAKICYTASTTFQTALDSINEAKPEDAFNKQFACWIEQMSVLYYAYTATFFAISQKQKGEDGMAIGLIRLSIKELKKVDKLHKKNDRPNKAIEKLIEILEPVDKKWSEENFIIAAKAIADTATADRFIATSSLALLNLPQPVPYHPPEATGLSSGNAPQEEPKVVKKVEETPKDYPE